MKPRKRVEKTRRSPRHRRALVTVETIFEATAHILEAEGMGALNTNRIAERAGVSIGTLYAYFPNKQAILLAMARRQLEEDRKMVLEALAPVIDDPKAPAERIAIRATIDLYARHTKVRQIAMQTMISLGFGDELTGPSRDVAGLAARRFASGKTAEQQAVLRTRLFIVSCAVEAAIRTAAYSGLDILRSPFFEDELVSLVITFLGAPASSRASPVR
jgi:AcrR family transcriptional regulator